MDAGLKQRLEMARRKAQEAKQQPAGGAPIASSTSVSPPVEVTVKQQPAAGVTAATASGAQPSTAEEANRPPTLTATPGVRLRYKSVEDFTASRVSSLAVVQKYFGLKKTSGCADSSSPPKKHRTEKAAGELPRSSESRDAGCLELRSNAAEPCRIVDLYEPCGKISEGVYGVVFKGKETSTGKMFALKQVKGQWLRESQVGFPPYLLREFDIILRAKHPNVVHGIEVVRNTPSAHPPDCDASASPTPVPNTGGVPPVVPAASTQPPPLTIAIGAGGKIPSPADFVVPVLVPPASTCVGTAVGVAAPLGIALPGDDVAIPAKKPPQQKQKQSGRHSIFLVAEYCPRDLKGLLYSARYLHLSSRNSHPDAPAAVLSRIKSVMRQLLTGLAFMHENRLVHRDIKTSNILVDDAGVVKICDFGLARHYQEGGPPLSQNVVTLMYRAPELHFGVRDYGAKVDIWSAGCIMGELFLKAPLFAANEEVEHFQCLCDILGMPDDATTFEGFLQLNEAVMMMMKLKRYNRENKLVERFRDCKAKNATLLSESGFDLLKGLLKWNPKDRLSAVAALQHPWLASEAPLPCEDHHQLLAPLPYTEAASSPKVAPSRKNEAPPPTNGAVPAAAAGVGDRSSTPGGGDGDDDDAEVGQRVGTPQQVMTEERRMRMMGLRNDDDDDEK